MDAFDHFNHDYNNMITRVEINNSNAMEKIKKLFRIVEIFLILVFLTWASTRLPFAVRISGEYLRRLSNVLFSSVFIFLVSNVIVLTLFFKSRHLFHHHEHSQLISSEIIQLGFCEDFIESCHVDDRTTPFLSSLETSNEIVTFQDKQTILEVTTKADKNLEREKNGGGKQLRRTETTEKGRRDGGDEVVDELSNEEFQRAIESFIAKQIMFHKQEKLPIVLHASTTIMPNYN